MSNFFHANPVISRYVHADTGVTSKRSYEIVDQSEHRLAYAYEDLGKGGGGRLLRDFFRSVAETSRFVVEDARQQPILALTEERGRRKTTILVEWAAGGHVGTVTMERMRGAARGYHLSDAHGREWGQLIRHDPHQGRGVMGRRFHRDPLQGYVYTATDHQGQEVARLTDAKRLDTSPGYDTYVSDHVLQLHYAQLPEPLSTLLRVSAVAVDFAEFTDS